MPSSQIEVVSFLKDSINGTTCWQEREETYLGCCRYQYFHRSGKQSIVALSCLH